MDEERRDRRRSSLDRPLRLLGGLIRALLGPTRAVRGTARRVADPARQVADYWASERATVKQAVIAIVISAVTSLVAGLTLAAMDQRLGEVKGLFVLIPVSIGMRGNIFGALAARLGTSIHTGLFEVSSERDGPLFQNVYSATLLTVSTSVTMGVLARSIAGLLGIATVSTWDFIAVALVGGLLSSAFVLAFTVYLSITSYRHGWDLDSVGAILITTVGDIVTLPCLLLASYLVAINIVTPAIGMLAVVAGIASLILGARSTLPVVKRVVRESFPVLSIAIVLDILAGTVVEPRFASVFGPYPAFLMIIPGFLENTGALGSILSARLGSKLHLGAVTPTAKPDAAALLDGTIAFVLGVLVYSITAITTLLAAQLIGANYPGAYRFVGVVMVGGLMATVVAGAIGYYAAIVTYRLGLDPDNHTIPLVSSGMDLLGVICLVMALVMFGVA